MEAARTGASDHGASGARARDKDKESIKDLRRQLDASKTRCERYVEKVRRLREELLSTASKADRAVAEERGKRREAERALGQSKDEVGRAVGRL